MSYTVVIENDHVYVRYAGVVDGLDIVRITADQRFINNLRRLQKVIHDFSFSEDVNLGPEDMKDFAVISNIESNFSEKLVAVFILKNSDGYERVSALSQAIKSPDWTILVAQNYEDALIKI